METFEGWQEEMSPDAKREGEGQGAASNPKGDASYDWVMETHHGGAHEDYGRDGISYE